MSNIHHTLIGVGSWHAWEFLFYYHCVYHRSSNVFNDVESGLRTCRQRQTAMEGPTLLDFIALFGSYTFIVCMHV